MGTLAVEVAGGVARIAGTDTIAGSTATMDQLFRFALAHGAGTPDEVLRPIFRGFNPSDYSAGIAGAVFHTNKGFDLDPDSMMTQIGGSGVEYDVINGLSAALASATTSPISVTATCTANTDRAEKVPGVFSCAQLIQLSGKGGSPEPRKAEAQVEVEPGKEF